MMRSSCMSGRYLEARVPFRSFPFTVSPLHSDLIAVTIEPSSTCLLNMIALHADQLRHANQTLTIAMIPAIMTGTTHFIIKSGRKTDIAEIPTPDLAVPYAAPIPNGARRTQV